jgi:hypothetical protein
MAKPAETRETLAQKAEHTRRRADLLPDDAAAERLRAYADELDAQAAALRHSRLESH